MKPVIALVGRPNVGKSTLFNWLTRSRDALVADQPGLTRDRKYGAGRVGEKPYIVIDTGGLSGIERGTERGPERGPERGGEHGLDELMAAQAWLAVEEANAVLFLVDAREGLNVADQEIATRLRQSDKSVYLVVNKVDGADPEIAKAEFHRLGMGQPYGISAAHGAGVAELMDDVLRQLPTVSEEEPESPGIKIAVIGKPNVGKSTLVNRILGEERVLTYDMPGTTRDSIYIPFERYGKHYTLIDTAGVRRRSRVDDKLEKFSVIKALQAIEEANVVVLVVDARQGVSDQDAHLLGFVLDTGRALIIAVNKWDGLDSDQRERVKQELDRRLQFVDFAEIRFISALHGTGVGELYAPIETAYEAARKDLSTPALTKVLEEAVAAHQPQLVRGRRIKLRYAHQGGKNPPTIVIHGNQTDQLPGHYKRYLEKYFREALQLYGTPLRLEFKSSSNPFAGRRNKLTPRQMQKKKRLVRHVKKSGR